MKQFIQQQKHGVIGLTKSLAKELGPSNIKVNGIAPGFIMTDMNKELNEDEIKEVESEISLKRIGTIQDIANSAYMLTQNEYITGQIITVDGGWIE